MSRHRSVKRIFCFSSGVRNRLPTAAAGLVCAMLRLDAASRRENLLPGRRAHLDAAHRHGTRELAVGQHLRRTLPAMHPALLGQRFLRHLGPLGPAVQRFQGNDLMLDAELVREPALRQPTREGHLTTLEVRFTATRAAVASACLASLVAFARRLARTGARPAPNALPVPMRSPRGTQVFQSNSARLSHNVTPSPASPSPGGALA